MCGLPGQNDLIVLSGDLIAERALFHLADLHRVKESSVTIMLKVTMFLVGVARPCEVHTRGSMSSLG